jgi:hypothetical protein
MGKRLSANAPKPRTRFPFPGYPTVAAAGLYLCLSGGCSRQPGLNDTTNAGGSRTGGTTGAGGLTSNGTVDTTNTGGYLAGAVAEPFEPAPEPDAGAPDVLPPAPDVLPPAPEAETPDVMEPPSPQDADLTPTAPYPTGGAPIPY